VTEAKTETPAKQPKTLTVDIDGEEYTLRVLKVRENDQIWDASQNKDGTTNERLNSRLSLAAAIVSPPTKVEEIDDWDVTKLVRLFRVHDTLNVVKFKPDPQSGNGSGQTDTPG
jgi:hypothetical protein